MSDREKLDQLMDRLEQLSCAIVPASQRTIVEVGRLALQAEITELGRRIAYGSAWIRPARRALA